jgi:hypothetical protein
LRLPIRGAILSALAAALASALLSSCGTPLSPGYTVLKEAREVQFVAGGPPSLHIQSTYTLLNSGTSELNFIDVTFPIASEYGRADARAELDGHPTPLDPLPAEYQFDSPNDLRVSFAVPWKQGERHDLLIEYWFRAPFQPGIGLTLGPGDFHLGSRGAFAVLEPPKHLFAPFPKRPAKMDYVVRVPADFRVLARGSLVGHKKDGNDVEYRFRLAAKDLTPFVVAGRYAESTPNGEAGPIVWSFQPLSIDAAEANEIGQSWDTLDKDFGPLDKNIHAPHIVEATDLPEHIGQEQGFAAAAFPGGALVSPTALSQAAQSEEFVEAVSHALAHNWLGDQIFAAPDATIGLGEGLPEYAMIAIDEDRGGEAARKKRIQRYLAAYDKALREANEQTLAVARITDPAPQRRIALDKAPLFFAAIEDQVGSDTMKSALKDMVTLFRGQQVDYNVLRSELEQKSGKNLAPTFRLWLNERAIPEEFRARYGG